MLIADILPQSALLFRDMRVAYYPSRKRNHFFFPSFEYQTITSSRSPAYESHTMNSRTKTCTVTSFLLSLFAYLCSECFWPSAFQTLASHQAIPPHHPIQITSVSLGAKNWEPVCSTGDNMVHARAINQIPPNQR